MNQTWLPAIARTVIGAAHQRKGKPCQDFSFSGSFLSPGGQWLQLMGVSDGHGGERYWLSDVGSRLACEVAAYAVEAAVRQSPLDDQALWLHLLAEELPKVIHEQWLNAIHQDWKHQPNPDQQEFSPQLYGCTFGIVLMAPKWWGYTGLGDWDLVALQDGLAQLVSEEGDLPAAGEATLSLSMSDAAMRFKSRCNLVSLGEGQGAVKLLLSTDGIRKSCATDDDFESLCFHLSALNAASEIDESLMEITSQGSGDDVSVAISATTDTGKAEQVVDGSEHTRSELNIFCYRNIFSFKLILVVAVLLGSSLGAWKLFSAQKNVSRSSSKEAEIQRIKAATSLLCANPALINQAMEQNQKIFEQLSRSKAKPRASIEKFSEKPIAALIAYSKAVPGSKGDINLEPLDAIGTCRELKLALEQRWQKLSKLKRSA